ncbi:nuclear factor erythroid 2-related factor 1-like isoform X2 [Seriola dumerili]|uniref:Endoplasmic reticulum membrane sensor NFE2L1 n=1 Tax=Seriola dumerili TaxID=41447 RepID=A0A3B4UYY4_SERDU|nr:nuclear factor erythroid 2-related factor 1-like isoform X2 [Seriola dumerili]
MSSDILKTMLYLKKYFTEGLIQMAILLSLCGVRVDVGLEPYLPPSWHEMILGPTSAVTQTQFHNLRNRLEDGHGLHPKNVDLDGYFTARRLLGWVRSLDRVQVPHAELETWLVQREPDPLPMECPDQPSLLERAPAAVERERRDPSVEPRALHDNEEGTPGRGALNERGQEEEDEEDNLARMQQFYSWTEGGGRPGGSYGRTNRELTRNEEDPTSFSFEECLRLLDETFPFTEEQELSDVGSRSGELERHPPGRNPLLSPIILSNNPSLDLELCWQDLFAIMEPENTDVDDDMMTSFDHAPDSRPSGTPWGVGSAALHQNCNSLDNGITDVDQEVPLMETPVQHGLLQSPSQSVLEPALLPLIPSAELDDHSSALNTRDILKNSNMNTLHSPPDHMDLLGEDPSEDFCMGQNAEDNSSTLNINLLAQDIVDNMEASPGLQYDLYPEDTASFDVNFHLRDLTPSSSAASLGGNNMTEDLLTSPSSVFLVDKEDVGDDDGLPSPLSDLLVDAAILDEMKLFDMALEEGFSPEMAARLEEEGYLDCEVAKRDTGRDDDHSVSVTEDPREPRSHQQDGEEEADSDSGLSLDFSHSPASPTASETSYYSSSSSSSSTTSSSCVSAVESPYYEDEDEDAEEGLVSSDMEVEVTIKQEELEEEEMGAVGGGFPENVKLFSANYGDRKLLNGFPWLEHIGHDHTYNQPWSSTSPPSLGKMPTKHTKSSQPHHNRRHYHYSSSRHISETKMWSRDERRARALKIPFSNELIVNLPVDEFNDLLTSYQLGEDQLALIRDIRRRGKNKIAAQNCRKRKMGVLLGLEDEVSGLRRHRLRLLREKQDALRNLQEMKRRLNTLYQEVFSRLTDEDGRPLDATEYMLNFGDNDSVVVASREQEAWLPQTGEKTSKKQRNKKK